MISYEQQQELLKIAEQQLNSVSNDILGELLASYKDLKEQNTKLLKANKEYEKVLNELNQAAKVRNEEKAVLASRESALNSKDTSLSIREKEVSERESKIDLHDAQEEIKHLRAFNDKLDKYNATLFANKSIHQMISFSGTFPVHANTDQFGNASYPTQEPFQGNVSKTED